MWDNLLDDCATYPTNRALHNSASLCIEKGNFYTTRTNKFKQTTKLKLLLNFSLNIRFPYYVLLFTDRLFSSPAFRPNRHQKSLLSSRYSGGTPLQNNNLNTGSAFCTKITLPVKEISLSHKNSRVTVLFNTIAIRRKLRGSYTYLMLKYPYQSSLFSSTKPS